MSTEIDAVIDAVDTLTLMRAILRVALNADTEPKDLRDHTKHEKVDLVGEVRASCPKVR
ncbi:MAG: hypothetical protein ACTIJ6_05260 [Leucobacter sp.]